MALGRVPLNFHDWILLFTLPTNLQRVYENRPVAPKGKERVFQSHPFFEGANLMLTSGRVALQPPKKKLLLSIVLVSY